MIAAVTGFRWFERSGDRWEARFSWAEITNGWGLALALCLFETHYSLHIHLGWPNINLRLPMLRRWHYELHEGMESWGLSLERDNFSSIYLRWGRRHKFIYLPWAWEWVRTSYLLKDGTWLDELRSDRPAINGKSPHKTNFDHWQAIRAIREEREWTETHPYRYTLRSGQVQECEATIAVQQAECRWRWLLWCPWFGRISKAIDIRFSAEVGERAGSWKGGTIGCGYSLAEGETPLQCLRRMERERKFT